MKKWISVTLILLLMLQLCSCTQHPSEQSMGFYYPAIAVTASQNRSGLFSEPREEIPIDDIHQLIVAYLTGPQTGDLYFPAAGNAELLDITTEDKQVSILFSDKLADIPPKDITLTAIGLAATLFQLTDMEQIEIACESDSLNGKPSLVFTRSDIAQIVPDIIKQNEVTE